MKNKIASIAVLIVAFCLWVAMPTVGNASPLILLATATTAQGNDESGGDEDGGNKVPDAGSTALLLGSALGGIALVRRYMKR